MTGGIAVTHPVSVESESFPEASYFLAVGTFLVSCCFFCFWVFFGLLSPITVLLSKSSGGTLTGPQPVTMIIACLCADRLVADILLMHDLLLGFGNLSVTAIATEDGAQDRKDRAFAQLAIGGAPAKDLLGQFIAIAGQVLTALHAITKGGMLEQ